MSLVIGGLLSDMESLGYSSVYCVLENIDIQPLPTAYHISLEQVMGEIRRRRGHE